MQRRRGSWWARRRRDEIARDVGAELDFHVEMRTRSLMEAGMTEPEARQQARAELGKAGVLEAELLAVDTALERRRAQRRMLDELRQDVRFAARALRARAGFSAAAIATLAVGIGAVVAVFSVIDGVLLKPLPVTEQDRLLVAWISLPERDFERLPFHYEQYESVRDRLTSISGVAAHVYHGSSRTVVHRNGEPIALRVAGVTGDLLGVLGVRAHVGRMLRADDDRVGAAPAVVLARATAERLYGSAAAALGRTLRINEKAYTVVGVGPAAFDYPGHAEAWAPATQLLLDAEGGARSLREAARLHWYLVARVAPGFTMQQAQADLSSALAALPESASLAGQVIGTAPFAEMVVGDVRPQLVVLGSAVVLVLLIAGVNVANLLLVRGIARRRELALRSALGASRARIMRQLGTEAVLLVAAGAFAGVPVAHVALRALLALAPAELPRLAEIGIDGRALAFTGLAALMTAAVFGVLPALRAAGADERALRERDGNAEPRTRARRLRHGLVVVQIAIATLVFATASQLWRSLDRLQRLEPGFAANEVTLVELGIPPARYRVEGESPRQAMLASTSQHQSNMVRLAEIVARLPGVTDATAVLTHPFAGNAGADAVWYGEGQTAAETSNPYTNYEGVDGTYFRTMRVPILQGRPIEPFDRAGSALVVVVNRRFAELYWPGLDPVGRRIKLGSAAAPTEWRTVVGVAADTRYRELVEAAPTVYVPYEQGIPVTPRYLGLRTGGEPGTLAPQIRRVIAEAEPSASIVRITPLPRLLQGPLARPRFQTVLVGAFAALGLGLSAIGTYSVLAFFVRQRTREIGIRMALGAAPSNLRGLVLRQGLGLGAPGVLLGMVGASFTTPFMPSLLFAGRVADPVALTVTAAVLLGATAIATVLPTRQALHTDPLTVMRAD